MASAHAENGDLVGYVVVDRVGSSAPWAALLSMPGLSVDDASLLARSITSELAFLSVPRGSAHCLFTGTSPERRDAERRAYLDALTPLTEPGLLQIVLEDGARGPVPSLARAGLVASAVAAVATLLGRSGRRGRRATVGQHLPTPLSEEVARVLDRDGICTRSPRGPSLAAEVDVLLVGAPLWSLADEEAALVRSSVLVSLATARVNVMAEQTLHERSVAFVQSTVASSGRFHALHLREQGVAPHLAVAQTAAAVSDRVAEVLETFADRPFAEAARDFAGVNGG